LGAGYDILARFFALHMVVYAILFILVVLHIRSIHKDGATNPGKSPFRDKVRFYPYFFFKDFFTLLFSGLFFMVVLFFTYHSPALIPEKFMKKNPLSTPVNIQPEWYFLPFYAILRSKEKKLIGVILLVLAILGFISFPLVCYLFNIQKLT